MAEILEKINALVWGVPALAAILGVGLYLAVRTRFVQLRLFPEASMRFWRMLRGKEGKSSFRCLCTALGATVGTGNLVGVAGAICLGGPGSIFWMWVCGILGMGLKYAEVVLAMEFRVRAQGETLGGPMYVISKRLEKKWHPMASLYCFFGVVAAFGVGNATQINTLIHSIHAITGDGSKAGDLLMGLGMAALVGLLLSGGAKRIGAAAEKLVPFAAAGYVGLCACVLILKYDGIADAFMSIVRGAWDPGAVTGGMLGSAFVSLRVGCARGVFTNEAGMGTAGIAHAGAQVEHPVQQGMMGIIEVFLDTIVICTLTALVILCSGIPIPYGESDGGTLTSRAFGVACGDWTAYFLAGSIGCFAFATVLGWGLYGIRCAGFLLGKESERKFVWLQMGASVLGALLESGVIWTLAEIMNAMMAIPNLICLGVLSKDVVRLTKEYESLRNL